MYYGKDYNMIIVVIDPETGRKIYEIPLKDRRERDILPVVVGVQVQGELKRYVVGYDRHMIEEMIKENI